MTNKLMSTLEIQMKHAISKCSLMSLKLKQDEKDKN